MAISLAHSTTSFSIFEPRVFRFTRSKLPGIKLRLSGPAPSSFKCNPFSFDYRRVYRSYSELSGVAIRHDPLFIARSNPEPVLGNVAEDELSGPIELPPGDLELGPLDFPEANPLQTFASIILTGSITLLLLRSLRRRTQRAKELKFRSSAVEKLSPKQKPSESSDISPGSSKPPEESPSRELPTPLNTLSGAFVSGIIAILLFRFTVGVEEGFANQAVSANYTVRNLTITIRTIITGVSWLSTFVFGFTSLGLSLYAVQLAFGLSPDNQDLYSDAEQSGSKSIDSKSKD